MCTLNYLNEPGAAAKEFRDAYSLLSLKIALMPTSSPEERQLLGLAKLHEAIAWSHAGERDLAENACTELRNHDPVLNEPDGLITSIAAVESRIAALS
jgi:hypothetical protein